MPGGDSTTVAGRGTSSPRGLRLKGPGAIAGERVISEGDRPHGMSERSRITEMATSDDTSWRRSNSGGPLGGELRRSCRCLRTEIPLAPSG